MATLESLAKEYGVTNHQMGKIFKSAGTMVFTSSWPLNAHDEQKIRNFIKQNPDKLLNETISDPVPVPQPNPVLVRHTKPVPAPQPDPVPVRHTKTVPTPQPHYKSAPHKKSNPLEEEKKKKEQEALLSRDYIVFTLSVLEKSGTQKILKQIIDLREKKHTRTKLIVVSAAIDELKNDAQANASEKSLMENYNLFKIMRDNGWIEVLTGTVVKEGITIGNYIRENLDGKGTILVLGKNMTLNTYIHLCNSEHMTNKDFRKPIYHAGYIPIEERIVHSSGTLRSVWMKPIFGCVGEEKKISYKDKEYIPVVETVPVAEKVIALYSEIPSEGENAYFYDNKNWLPIKLVKEISRGAEGIVYCVEDQSLCAKIFFAPSITERKMKKLELLCQEYEQLCSRDNSVMTRIAWPQSLLFNDHHQPIGYLMRRFEGVSSFEHFDTQSYGEFIHEEKEKQIIAAISFVELIRFLHDNNIVLCDINRGNLLYDNEQRAYLVDLDSAQISEKNPYKTENGKAYYWCYPANVATPQFISPEHIDEHVYTFRHSKADDVWSMQYMIFLLLTCCGAFLPYHNDAGSAEGKTDIRKGNYLYKSYYSGKYNISEDDSLFRMHCIISRLHTDMQRAFYQSFSGNGEKFRAEKRWPAKVWMIWLIKYYVDLSKMIRKDPEDGEYLPETIHYRKKGNQEYKELLDIFDSWLSE